MAAMTNINILRWRLAAWGGAASLILLPLLAIKLTSAVTWGPGDFLFAIILVTGVGLGFELAARLSPMRAYRGAAALALAASCFMIWVNGAVGIIGSEDNPINLLFFAVLVVGLAGAVIARLRPLGMSRTMMAMAATQVAVAITLLATGHGFVGPITVFFSGLWLASGWLFHKAARHDDDQPSSQATATS